MGTWYYAQNGESVGPIALTELQAAIQNGALALTDLVWREGMADWLPAQQVLELAMVEPAYAIAAPAATVAGYPQVMHYARRAMPVKGMAYAGFWKRVAASLIDWLVMLVPNFIIGMVIGFVLASGGIHLQAIEAFAQIVGLVVGWLYFAVMESSKHQGTLGKIALGIKVTDMNGGPISFGRATGRHFGKFISAIILGIGYIMAGFTEKKQGLHDIMADCLVVNR